MAERPGRPPVTTSAELERIALALFVERGFDATTVEDIAEAAGISRRTFFRYFPSKNDVVWGAFDELLDAMDRWLTAAPATLRILDAITEAVVRFNSLPPEAAPAHRQRMALILHTPALQAHSTLRYAEWRDVVARFVADRLGREAGDTTPQLTAHLALGVAVATYEQWLADAASALDRLFERGFAELGSGLPSLSGGRSEGLG
jgi:mycofactocin system transcriptional regulator